MTEKAMQEMDELNIKCLQVLRSIVHNEERKMPEDWATRTTEPAVKKLVPNNTKKSFVFRKVPLKLFSCISHLKDTETHRWYTESLRQEGSDEEMSASPGYQVRRRCKRGAGFPLHHAL